MKNKVGFFLPAAVEKAFDDTAEDMVGGKEKWLVITAAIISFIEKSAAERKELVRRVRAEAGKDGDFPRLVADAIEHSVALNSSGRKADRRKPHGKHGEEQRQEPPNADAGSGRGRSK